MVVDLQPEGAGAARHGLPNAPHADDSEALTGDSVPEHPGRRPASPGFFSRHDRGPFGEPARHRENERHGHVGGVLGEDARRIGDGDAALEGGRDVNIVDAVAEIGDELHLLAGMAQRVGVDAVGDRRHEHVGSG